MTALIPLRSSGLRCAIAFFGLVAAFSYSSIAGAEETCVSCAIERHSKWAFGLSPQYYVLNTEGYAGAFTRNGFSAPKDGGVGIDFNFYLTNEASWETGLAFGEIDYGSSATNGVAEFSQGYVGLWLGKNWQITTDLDFVTGLVLGYDYARLEVISSNPAASGRTDESAFLVAPKLLFTYQISLWVKVGLSASYSEPISPNDSITGQGLNTGDISIHSAKAGIDLIFGHF